MGKKRRNIAITITAIILILLFLIACFLLWIYFEKSSCKDIVLLAIISIAGAFGGILYTLKDNGIELPHLDPSNENVINLGWISDCAYGIAGAYVVFLLLPIDMSFQNENSGEGNIKILSLIKYLALALVGGYGGRGLVDSALSSIAKKVEKAQQSVLETNKKITQIQELDTKTLELVNRHLDDNEKPQNIQELKSAIKVASRKARFEIFKEARAIRSANWNDNIPLMERTIPIFEALIENEAGEKFHRNHSQLGYALKDQGGQDEAKKDWIRAHQELTNAIGLRDEKKVDGFLIYEFNRALCSIKLGKDFEFIANDIKKAAENYPIYNIIKKNETIKKWAAENQYDLEKLKKESN